MGVKKSTVSAVKDVPVSIVVLCCSAFQAKRRRAPAEGAGQFAPSRGESQP